MRKRRFVSGYFSVEAALILPAVLSVYLFLITVLLVQYDRCLLEQDMASLLVKVSSHSGTPRQQLEYLQELTVAWDKEQYLWVQLQAPCFTIQGQRIQLEVKGDYGMPVYGSLAGIGGPQQMELSFLLYNWDRTALVQMLAGWNDEENEKLQEVPFHVE